MPSQVTEAPVVIALENDYAFRPAHNPDAWILPATKRLVKGTALLRRARSSTPNRWVLIDARTKESLDLEDWDKPAVQIAIGHLKGFCDLVDESQERIDYGPLSSYIPLAMTSAFSDAGLPFWSDYRLSTEKLESARCRWEKAVRCANGFNNRFGANPVEVGELTAPAQALLALSDPHATWSRLWMFRSLASAALELVEGGFARVNPEGYLEPEQHAYALATSLRESGRCVQINWRHPAHIEKQHRARRAEPWKYSGTLGRKIRQLCYQLPNSQHND